MKEIIPVILDTDIGGDIDDTWALALLLRCPQLQPLLITCCTENTTYRAKLCAKFLQRAGRAEIPIAVGPATAVNERRQGQMKWVADYSLNEYPGQIHQDGIDALIRTVKKSDVPVTLIAIGPLTNVAEAVRQAPEIADKVNLVAMAGSIEKGLSNKPGKIAEFNIAADIPAAQKVFETNWRHVIITPLDSCGRVQLGGELFRQLYDSTDRMVQDVMENYRLWRQAGGWDTARPLTESSILFDTVAVHLAFSQDFLIMQEMHLAIDGNGYMNESPSGLPVNVALDWKDLDGFERFLTERLLNQL